jgi:hypothetical protein
MAQAQQSPAPTVPTVAATPAPGGSTATAATASVPANVAKPAAAGDHPDALPTVAEIIHRAQGSLVLVEGHEGAGSGFICELDGQKYLLTNDHVLAGNTEVRITLLDGQPVRVGAAATAVGHDLMRLAVAPELPALSILEHLNETLLVGDEVLVLGNEKGARVVTPLVGKVVGLGPDLIEVDAPFQPGNSGSPIIQAKSGKVVGIATFVRVERDDLGGGGARPSARAGRNKATAPGGSENAAADDRAGTRLRRFGYRVDNVRAWQPVAWPEFAAEAGMVKKLDAVTEDILALIRDINESHGHITVGKHYDPLIQRPLQDFFDTMSQRPSPSDALVARQQLLDGLRRACEADVADVVPRLRYDYFQRKAAETKRFREELAKGFDEALKAQANNTGR